MDTRSVRLADRRSARLRRILSLLLAVSLASLSLPALPVAAAGAGTANAGPDITVESGEMVALQGSASGTPISYVWEQETGPVVVLAAPTYPHTFFWAPTVSTTTVLQFKFTADDGLSTAEDWVDVTVTPRWDGGPQKLSPSPYKYSSNPVLGSSDGRVYAVWSEGGAAYFSRRDVGEGTFAYPMSLSGLVMQRQANWNYSAPQLASSGATVCVAFEAYVAQQYEGKQILATEAFLATSRDHGASFTVEMVSRKDDGFAARFPKVAIAEGHTYVVYQNEAMPGGPITAMPLEMCVVGAGPVGGKQWHAIPGLVSASDNSGFDIAALGDRAGMVYADSSARVRLETWVNGSFVSNKPVSPVGQLATRPHIASGGSNLFCMAWEELRERPRPPGAGSTMLPAREVWSAFIGAPDTIYRSENLSNSPATDSSAVQIAAFNDTYCVGWLEGNQESSPTRKLMLRSTGRPTAFGLTFAPASAIADVSGGSAIYAHPMRLSGSGDAVHVAWSSIGPSGIRDVYVALSTDAGMTFPRQKTLSDSSVDSFDPAVATVAGAYVSVWCKGPTWYFGQSRSEIFTRSGGYSRDIGLLDLQVVQGPLDATSLVSGRKTVIRAVMHNGNPTKQDVEFSYELKINRSGGGVETTSGVETVKLGAASTSPVYLPKDSFYQPQRGAAPAAVSAKVSVVASDPNANTDPTNDDTSTAPVPLVKTKDFRFTVAPITLPGDPARSDAQINAFRVRAIETLRGFLPVNEDSLWGVYGRSALTSATMNSGGAMSTIPSAPGDPRLTPRQEAMIDSDLARLAAIDSADISFGIVENSFFEKRMADSAGTLGLAPYCVPPRLRLPVALLRWKTASMGSVIPHEVMHTYGWVNGPADATGLAGDPLVAATGADPSGHMGLRAPGFWVEKRLDFSTTAQDLMHPVVSSGLPYWVSPITWQYMVSALKVPGDPSAVLISGRIDDADHVDLDPWYRMDSVLDLELDAVGDVSIIYLDGGGAELARTAFTPSFQTSADDLPTRTVAPFVLRVPDVAGTAKIVLAKGGSTLAERLFSANAPVVSVLAPNGGETLTAEETVTVQWDASDSDGGGLVSTVQLSKDGGANWQTLAMDVAGEAFDFVPAKGDVTESAKVRVMVSDGVNTGADNSDAAFAIRPKEVPRTSYAEPVLQPTLPASYGNTGVASGVGADGDSLVVSGSKVYTIRRVEGYEDPATGATIPYQVFVDASDDGGATFTPRHVPPLDDTSAAAYGTQSFGGSGNDLVIVYADGGYKCVTSHDGGVTWSEPFVPWFDPSTTGVNFRQLLVSGQNVGMVLETYTSTEERIVFVASHDGGRTFDEPQMLFSTGYSPYGSLWASADAEGDRFNIAIYNLVPWTGTIPVSRKTTGLSVYTSLDGGRSFLSPTSIDTEDFIDWTQAVSDGDDLHLKYEYTYNDDIKVVTSHDGGLTFDAPVTITSTTTPYSKGNFAAEGGTVAVAWGVPGPAPVGGERILVSSSVDGGDTFGSPVDVTQPYALDNYGNVALSGVAVSGNNVYAVWGGILSAGGGTHTILRVSTDSGATFGEARDLCGAPHGGGYWGDLRDFAAVGPDIYSFRAYNEPYVSPSWQRLKTFFRRGLGSAGGGIGVDAGDDQTIDEGAYAGVSASYSGAATGAAPTATIEWGDGTVTDGKVTDVNGDGTVAGAHGYTSAGTYTVTVRLKDAEDVTGSDTQQVVVENLPPAVAPYPASPPLPVVGQRFALTGFPFSDAGVDEALSAVVEWGDGESSPGTVTVGPDAGAAGGISGTVDAEHTYAGAGTYTVRMIVSDGDASGDATMSLTAAQNHDPVADAGGPYETSEGAPVSLDASSSSDPDGDGLSYLWQVGGRGVGGLGNASPFSEVVFADDYDGMATLSVADGNGGTDEATALLAVANVAPYYFDLPDRSVGVFRGGSVEATAAFMDAGRLDTHTASFDWGDGSSTPASVEETQGEGVASGQHFYSAPGTYTVTAGVADDDGGSSETTFAVGVTFVNRPPVATDTTVTTTAGKALAVHLSATDPDGDPLTWLGVPVVAPTSGVLTGSPPDLTYAPNAGFVGDDVFAFQVSDGQGGSAVAHVTVTVAPAPVTPHPTAKVTRISGGSPYQIALKASRGTFKAKSVSRVVLASGAKWDDALAASGLAGTYHSPVLLTGRKSLPSGLVTELRRLGAKRVYIVGNTSSVSKGVGRKLKRYGFAVTRISGRNRYEVAKNVALKIEAAQGNNRVSRAFVVRSDVFYDALSVSALAYGRKMPVLYTRPTSMSKNAARAIRALDVDEVIVVGGTAAVRSSVAAAFGRLSSVDKVTRWGGKDRVATSAALTKGALSRKWVSFGFVGVTSCVSYSDGLSASSATGYRHGPLLLSTYARVPSATSRLLVAHKAEVKNVWVFARTTKVRDSVLERVRQLLK